MDFISLHDAVMVLGPPRNRCIYIEVNRSTPTNLHQKWNENEMVLQQQGVNFYAITTLMFFFLLFSNNFANYIHFMLIIPIKSTLIPDCNTTICRKVQGGYFIYIYIWTYARLCKPVCPLSQVILLWAEVLVIAPTHYILYLSLSLSLTQLQHCSFPLRWQWLTTW